MGFGNVAIDGVSAFQVEEELSRCNFLFYGDKTGKTDCGMAQYTLFKQARCAFEQQQQRVFTDYFNALGWDLSRPCQARANDQIWVKFDIENSRYLFFSNGDGRGDICFRFYVTSDFRENPACSFEDYRRMGKSMISYSIADMTRQLNSLKEVLKNNDRLEGSYHFRMVARPLMDNGMLNQNQIDSYSGIEAILNMISEKFF